MKNERTIAVANIIRNKREMLCYSQLYMATKLNISQNGYSKLELGYYDVTVDRLWEICDLLEIPVEEIFNTNIRMT